MMKSVRSFLLLFFFSYVVCHIYGFWICQLWIKTLQTNLSIVSMYSFSSNYSMSNIVKQLLFFLLLIYVYLKWRDENRNTLPLLVHSANPRTARTEESGIPSEFPTRNGRDWVPWVIPWYLHRCTLTRT